MLSMFEESRGTSVYGGIFNATTNTTYHSTRLSGKLVIIDRVISFL